jgi:hypothetical protein
MQRSSQVLDWTPKGVSDTTDATDAIPGAMQFLTNLIPDPTTNGLWQCRPASISLTSFAGFTAPGFISTMLIVGDFIYGLIATTRNAGNDEPFCYDIIAGVFRAMGGTISATTTPTSPATSGAWTPPDIAVIGSKVVIVSLGFNGAQSAAGNFYGYIDISTPTAPSWHALNFAYGAGLASHFTTAPSGVAQFNGRAYFIHPVVAQPAVIWSDVNDPTQNTVSSVTPVLTFGDSAPLTTLAGLPLNNQLGGVIQSLIVFKAATNTYQITGDSASANLTVNSLNIATGTFSPLSVVTTPKGLAFVSPDGLRIIDFYARVSDPLGIDGKGVNIPFILAVNPTRTSAACNGNVLRISVQNGSIGGTPTQEFWYDFARQIYHGPHTFPASLIVPYAGTFIVAPAGVTAKLFRSDQAQSLTSTFVENGQQLTWDFTTSFLPDTKQMVNYAMTESVFEVALASGVPPINITANNWAGSALDTVLIPASSGGTLWGAFLWGSALWGGVAQGLTNIEISWHFPIVFDRLQLQFTGQSALAHRIGRIKGRYQQLRTWTNIAAVA